MCRVVREGKERRRLWAEKKTPRPSKKGEIVEDVAETPAHNDQISKLGMLPSNLVQLLADREKYVFLPVPVFMYSSDHNFAKQLISYIPSIDKFSRQTMEMKSLL